LQLLAVYPIRLRIHAWPGEKIHLFHLSRYFRFATLAFQFAVKVFVRTEQEQEPGCRVEFISQQCKLADALEFVDEVAGEVAFLGFAYFGRGTAVVGNRR